MNYMKLIVAHKMIRNNKFTLNKVNVDATELPQLLSQNTKCLERQPHKVAIRQWRKFGSKSGGRQGEARRAKGSRLVGPRGGGVLGKGMCPLPPAKEHGDRCKISHWGPGRSPGDLAMFVDFSHSLIGAIQTVISSTRTLVQQNIPGLFIPIIVCEIIIEFCTFSIHVII